MTASTERPAVAGLRSNLSRHAARAVSLLTHTPPPTTTYRVHRGVRIPMRDGVELLADHYAPDTERPAGTLLVRGPYGRTWPFSSIYAAVYAMRGYHVVLQSVRGTFGSGGEFQPTVNEAADGVDTAAWLRDQPWFTGTFGTVGPSYLGATQWALLQDPPPELAAAVIVVGVHDFAATTWGTGSFGVNDFLGWSLMVSRQEDPNRLRTVLRQLTAGRVVARAGAEPPLGASGRKLLGVGAPWWESWLTHPDTTDPFWDSYRFARALEQSRVPVLLVGGWQDLFLEQTLEQYRALRDRDVDVALTIGPWTHSQTGTKGAPEVLRESLQWFGTRLGDQPAATRSAVRVFVTGGGGWLDLPDWPPATSHTVCHPDVGGRLSPEPGPVVSSTFTFDPSHPTPTIGGRLLAPSSGRRRDNRLAERSDVLAFTGAPLPSAVFVLGAPVVELRHEADNDHVDLFVRVSEVDAKGRSRNVSDGYVRLRTATGINTVTMELDPIAHRFAAGSRIRLLIAGGSFPRYAVNLGTGEPVAEGARRVPATHVIHHDGSRLLLPASPSLPG
ncbi:CocE/NonD family hydrolase [soil metagenome]